MTGSYRVAKAEPDGYTILLGDRPCSRKTRASTRSRLRRRDRFRAGSAVRGFGAHPDHAQGSARLHAGGVCLLRQGQTTPRCNTPRPARDRACTSAPCCSIWRWHQHHPRSLSRQRARAAGHDRGPHRLHVRSDIDRGAPDPGRRREGDRHRSDRHVRRCSPVSRPRRSRAWAISIATHGPRWPCPRGRPRP